MKDISNKFETLRSACAMAKVNAKPESIQAIKDGKVPKGNVLEVARTAAIINAKKTSDIIPFCHQIALDYVSIDFELDIKTIIIKSYIVAIAKTGVEMEALTAVSVAALTVYDMLKQIDNSLRIESIELIDKKGGKSTYTEELDRALTAGILVLSDSTTEGLREDKSGKIIESVLKQYKIKIVYYKIVPDEKELIKTELVHLCDVQKVDIILTTGGTGLGKRDNTPEATMEIIEKIAPGITEAIRSYGQRRTPYAMLSRAIAGIRNNTLIINLPGSSRGVQESLNALFPAIFHAQKTLWGSKHD